MNINELVGMAKKTVSLSVEEEVYEEYRKYCEQKGIILSKQFENFMVEELKKKEREFCCFCKRF